MNDKPERMPNVPPFVRFVASAVPMVFDNSLSYYEALCALWKYLQDMADVVNNNATLEEEFIDKVNELETYVNTYFDNLDVQEEINNKLDEMAEAGTLQEIITTYIQANVAWTFDTVADMKQATNLVDGSYARTLGFHTLNDGGGALYKITNTGTSNEMDVIAIGSLFANLVLPPLITPDIYGAYGDGTHDDSSIITYAFGIVKTSGGTFAFGAGKTYLVDGNVITMNGVTNKVTINGNNAKLKQQGNTATATIYYNENLTVNDLNLEGSYDGVSTDTVYFGFRSANASGNCVFNNCSSTLMTGDGWYSNSGTLVLNNCRARDNYRCDVTSVKDSLIINGGHYGNGTYTAYVASIDVEPNDNLSCNFVSIDGCISEGRVQIWSNAGGSRIAKALLKNITLDNTNGNASLRSSRVNYLEIENLIKINSPSISINDSSVRQKGFVSFNDEMPLGTNLIQTSDFSGWTPTYSGGSMSDVDISLFSGKNITTPSGKYYNLKKDVTLEANTTYTFGLLLNVKSIGGDKTGMFIILGDNTTYTLQNEVDSGIHFVSCEFNSGANTSASVRIGSGTSTAIDIDFAKPFLVKGRINKDSLSYI